MPVRQMREAQIVRFTRSMEEQGVGVTRTKKGLLLRLPGGESTVMHFTESDVRAQANLIARLRRANVTHPDDPRGPLRLPTYITEPQPKERTLDKARAIIEKMGYPERVATSDLYDTFATTDAGRMLYFLGYRPSTVRGKRGMRLWDAPEELDHRFRAKMNEESAVVDAPEDPPLEAVAPVDIQEWVGRAQKAQEAVDEIIDNLTPEDERELEEAIERHPAGSQIEAEPEDVDRFDTPVSQQEPAVKVEPNGREYIDTDDSWAVDMGLLLGEHLHRMVRDRLQVLTAVGMDYEIRVWRKK